MKVGLRIKVLADWTLRVALVVLIEALHKEVTKSVIVFSSIEQVIF